MDTLKVDTTALRDAAADLHTVGNEFKEANTHSEALADAVGHGDLATHIKDFSLNWEQKRGDMVKDIEELHKKLLEGADAMEKADKDMAHSLTHPSKSAPATPTAPHGAAK